MRKFLLTIALIISASMFMDSTPASAEEKWLGVDETVVGKFADEAGRPASDPYINTDQGDLLLFVFLMAGVVGGFAMGYYSRQLFGSEVKIERGIEER